MLSQVTEEVRYELIVVDNNSTDGTKSVISSFISRGHPNLRYVFEPNKAFREQQGTPGSSTLDTNRRLHR